MENDGKAVIATVGGRRTQAQPGKLLVQIKAFNLMRERQWVAIDAAANHAAGMFGNWVITPGGRQVYRLGWYLQQLGDI